MDRRRPEIPLPRDWRPHVKSGFLHAVALVHRGMTAARGWCADSPLVRVRQAEQIEGLRGEVAMLREELRLKDPRLGRIAPAKRPHYPPVERLAVLALGAARGWSQAELGRCFHVTAATIASWHRRLDEGGQAALVKLPDPVNRFPEFVAMLVQRMKATAPAMGKVRIAQVLARAGLHLGPSTVRRMLERQPSRPEPDRPEPESRPNDKPTGRTVVARYPNHAWGIDLTVVPTALGFWVPWMPFAIAPGWPFAWWVVVVVDYFSRRALAVEAFRKAPGAEDVCSVLDTARGLAGTAPKYAVTDRGAQFQSEYRRWCCRRGVKPRYGAVGRHGSIALVERFILSLKTEGLGVGLVPLGAMAIRTLLDAFVRWYNVERPHQGLEGRTPLEVYEGTRPAHLRPRIEPRARCPANSPCAAPRVAVRGQSGARIELTMSHPNGAPHLPVVRLRRAA